MTNEVLLENRDGVLEVTLNRPEKRNAMSATMLRRLVEVFSTVGDDASVRVVLVRGAGKSFCTGLDLAEMQAAKQASGTIALSEIEDVFRALEAVPQPTIAAVAGEAIAGGCELALHCDLRVAATNARFAMPLAKLGISLPFPLVAKLVERIGTGFTSEILFTAEPFTGPRAYELGMVNRLVEPDALESAARELATTIAANAPLSLRALKRVIARTRMPSQAIDFRDLLDELRRVAASEDMLEGVRAIREKRKPKFQGR
jgi:enoyl-CoA hydratase/carnithine racemase